jgi:hypothetical protein
MHFDFNSAIENARFFAARDEALRRQAESVAAAPAKPGRWGRAPAVRWSGSRERVPAAPFTRAERPSHAH